MEHRVYQCTDKLLKDSTYSAKKCYHTFTQLIGVNKEGRIWFTSKSYPGSVSDTNLANFNENHIFRKLEANEKSAVFVVSKDFLFLIT
jgi:hypothetical protein